MKKLLFILAAMPILNAASLYAQAPSDRVILSTQLAAQPNEYFSFLDVMDDFFEKYADKANFTGIPLTVQCPALYRGDARSFAIGRSRTDGSRLSKNALFQVGSITKSFVSVVLLQLEAEGLLGPQGLQSPVGNFLPEYTLWKDITISQLLHMTSGIRDYVNDDSALTAKYNANPYLDIDLSGVLDTEKDAPLMFAPGSSWHYSNTNYTLAAKIAEKVTGNSIGAELKKRIFKPLNLKHTHYTTLPAAEVPMLQLRSLMSGYYYGESDKFTPPHFKQGQDVRYYSLAWANAAGAIISTSDDINTYARALFQPQEAGGELLTQAQIDNELLSFVSVETGQPLAQIDVTTPRGYGLGVGAIYDEKTGDVLYSHNGGTLGFHSTWMYDRAKQTSFVTAINTAKELKDNDYMREDLMMPLLHTLLRNCEK